MTEQKINRSGDAANCEHMRTTCVLSLLLVGLIANVSRFISPIVIDPSDCHTLGHLPGMNEKCLKRVSPFIADRYASPAITGELWMPWTMTPGNHVFPRNVGPCLSSPDIAARMAMLCIRLPSLTPARGGVIPGEVHVLHDNLFPAFALAKAHADGFSVGSGGVWCFRKNFELSKGESGDVYFGRHNDGDFIVMFSGGIGVTTGPAASSNLLRNPINTQSECVSSERVERTYA